MALIPITFSKGLNVRNSPLALKDGELVSVTGLDFIMPGELNCRADLTAVNATAIGSIHTLHRYINWLLAGDGATVRYKWDLNGYCSLYVPPDGNFTSLGTLISSNRLRLADNETWVFMVNGMDKKAFTNINLYDWGVPNPTVAPGYTTGSGSISGIYTLYYTWVVMFPNGMMYETDKSPGVTTSSLSSNNILWNSIRPCPYTGTGLVIHRNLYRYSTTLAEYYRVDTIQDNTTTTYTDTSSDATLQGNVTLSTSGYAPPPDNMVDVVEYLGRIFGIKGSYLYYTEPYLPLAWPATNSLQVTTEGEDLIGAVQWADQLYMPSKYTWYRLQGTDSSTWGIKHTFAETGVINVHTMQKTRYGILGLWWDGIYLFDGSITRNITREQMGTSFFDGLSAAGSEWDGKKYYLYYATTSTLVVDFSDYPNLKCYNDNAQIRAYEYHYNTGIKYMGKADGYQYEESGSETIATSLQTGDKVGETILKRKNLKYLYYDVMTGGVDLTLTIYGDGTAFSPTITINTSSRTRKRVALSNCEAYRYSIALSCANSRGLVIYEPWALEFTSVGD